MKDVAFDNKGVVLRVNGKAVDRRIRIVASEPELRNWIDNHPFKSNPEAFVWISLGNKSNLKPLSYNAATEIVKRLAKRAGIKKKANLYALRHARTTHLASKLTEAQMKQLFGWIQGSRWLLLMYI